MEQIQPGLLVSVIGNTYAGAAIMGLTATIDIAQPGDRTLVVSFSSGAGSDAFDITVTDKVTERAGGRQKPRIISSAEPKLITRPMYASAANWR